MTSVLENVNSPEFAPSLAHSVIDEDEIRSQLSDLSPGSGDKQGRDRSEIGVRKVHFK